MNFGNRFQFYAEFSYAPCNKSRNLNFQKKMNPGIKLDQWLFPAYGKKSAGLLRRSIIVYGATGFNVSVLPKQNNVAR